MIKNNRDVMEKIICINSILFTKEEYELIREDKLDAIKNNKEEIKDELNEIGKEYIKSLEQIIEKGVKENNIKVSKKNDDLLLEAMNDDNGIKIIEEINELQWKKDDEIDTLKHLGGTNYVSNYDITLDFNNEQDLLEIIDIVKEEYYDSDDEKFKERYINEVKYNIKNLDSETQKIILDGADLYITSLLKNNINLYLSKIDDILNNI